MWKIKGRHTQVVQRQALCRRIEERSLGANECRKRNVRRHNLKLMRWGHCSQWRGLSWGAICWMVIWPLPPNGSIEAKRERSTDYQLQTQIFAGVHVNSGSVSPPTLHSLQTDIWHHTVWHALNPTQLLCVQPVNSYLNYTEIRVVRLTVNLISVA